MSLSLSAPSPAADAMATAAAAAVATAACGGGSRRRPAVADDLVEQGVQVVLVGGSGRWRSNDSGGRRTVALGCHFLE